MPITERKIANFTVMSLLQEAYNIALGESIIV